MENPTAEDHNLPPRVNGVGGNRGAAYAPNRHCGSAEDLAKALDGTRQGAGFMACCPAHDDTTPSLSISEKKGKILVRCHTGCKQDAVLDALRARGLWPEKPAGDSNGTAGKHGTIIAAYDYVGEQGELLFQALRMSPKNFRQRRPDGRGGWIWDVKGVRAVPYRLPEILEAIASERSIFVVEGEKDADSLARLGITATCNAGGAGKWRAEHAAFLDGADVVIIGDNDDAGRQHAKRAAKSLHGIAARVRILDLPGLPEKGDVSDWLSTGGTAEQLWMLVDTALNWREAAVGPPKPAGGCVWGTPDPSVAQFSQFPAPTMPLAGFGPEWADWIEKTAEAKNAPMDYVALALLAGASGLIGVRRLVSPWNGWREPAILWGALVGPPSTNKSPAIDSIRAAIVAAESKRAENFSSALADHELRASTAKLARKAWEKVLAKAVEDGNPVPTMPEDARKPVPPVRPRLFVVNSTTEKLARIMAEQPGGLVCLCDELAGLIGGFDRYGGSGGDRAFWLECFGGRPYRLDRVGDGLIDIPFTAASVLGSIQPDRLNSLILSGDNDGFASRFLFAWPELLAKRRPTRAPNPALADWAFTRLAALPVDWEAGAMCLPLAPDAVGIFQPWYEHDNDRDIRAASGVLADAFGKLNGGLLRIALNFELLRWAVSHDPIDRLPAPDQVSRGTIEDAIRFVEQWVKPMLRRVLAEASIPAADRNATTLARWLVKERPEKFNARTLRHTKRSALPGIRDAADMDEACGALRDIGWIREAGERQGETRGRRSKDYEVNPAIGTAAFCSNLGLPPSANSSVSSDSSSNRSVNAPGGS